MIRALLILFVLAAPAYAGTATLVIHGGGCTVTVTFNDTTLAIDSITVSNTSGLTCYGQISDPVIGIPAVSRTATAGTTQTFTFALAAFKVNSATDPTLPTTTVFSTQWGV